MCYNVCKSIKARKKGTRTLWEEFTTAIICYFSLKLLNRIQRNQSLRFPSTYIGGVRPRWRLPLFYFYILPLEIGTRGNIRVRCQGLSIGWLFQELTGILCGQKRTSRFSNESLFFNPSIFYLLHLIKNTNSFHIFFSHNSGQCLSYHLLLSKRKSFFKFSNILFIIFYF